MSLFAAFGIGTNQQIIVTNTVALGPNLGGSILSDGRKVYVGKITADEPSNWLPKTPEGVPCAPHMEVKNIKGALWLIDGRKSSTSLPTF